MPVQIDNLETTVEVTAPSAPAGAAPAEGRRGAPALPANALQELVGRMMAEELDRFLRNRGMG